ncbi:MAG: proline--tRNA ligase [Candidatus Omnitrophica bacterium]|nr:proline--tRNA ligase [Candidatus Omnitrophota bacterium]MBU2044898.1 proline--tRNA ligase [Candidatus Omnitrophota bacterium]MBU2473858.1 proline--tRNA ligase [Candidatus Omnitrophota bacterium]
MLFSKSFISTLRQDPKVAECQSHKFLLKGSFLFMVSSGIYSYLPLGWKVLNKINGLIRKHMDSSGAQEIFMSALQPIDIWQKTGRDKDLGEVMFTFKDRKGRLLCLGPTHEEEITEIVKRSVSSYKQLPVTLYQIQTKFRDEPRPRFGLMRSCEFIMKDAYSFDKDQAGLDQNYQKMLSAYKNIFKACGLKFIVSEADSGAMGGSVSHEFMVPGEIGEDIVDGQKMIEIGHIFKLGTKYSLAQEAFFLNEKGIRQPFVMGCYGIGVSRILSAVAEVNSDSKGLVWPQSIAPFDLTLVVLDKKLIPEALGLAETIESVGLSVLVDDRDEAAGVKFNDAYLLGNPYIAIIGKKYIESETIDLEVRKSADKSSFKKEELIKFLKSQNGPGKSD